MRYQDNLFRKGALFFCLIVLCLPAFAQNVQSPWLVTYQFLAPNKVGAEGREAIATFQVRNLDAGTAQNVVLAVPPASGLSLGRQNGVQVGDLRSGDFKIFQERFVDPLGTTKGRCPLLVKYLSPTGPKTVQVMAIEIGEVGHE
jgi:hypothetical protein